jgi:catechol 1,2-dioxygenase
MSSQQTKFDPDFTRSVIETMGPAVSERNRLVFTSLFKHLHDFAREVELTTEEWMAGVHFMNTVGQISTPVRNEMHRLSDVVGLESYVQSLRTLTSPA